ncbi:hypothetical protein TWF569_008309 [Orbilia oligospora]|nr:hypothetical protein TWF706_006978 [Orbilia oligospora]KAF3113296.1 hypothetical protein TWF103_002460 [Orbilia oligospora]KAF3140168.1 hypothetical protein TWF569_008309 [Orbilia oligospora]
MVPVAALGLTGSANEKANCGIDIVRIKLFLSDYAVKRPSFCRPPMVPTGGHLSPGNILPEWAIHETVGVLTVYEDGQYRIYPNKGSRTGSVLSLTPILRYLGSNTVIHFFPIITFSEEDLRPIVLFSTQHLTPICRNGTFPKGDATETPDTEQICPRGNVRASIVACEDAPG